ncbi:hypothetical protein R0135_01095 [Congregibacter variabilis]|uniref:Uncharacterized protein n=1 Tax=Congregibacter variabilis TaxID=3081200 RepID=A0ABZ0I2Q5_9GAMM|nr:hypothetical protein R0135_01095 [Congregibacter sp. IMCC43200]
MRQENLVLSTEIREAFRDFSEGKDLSDSNKSRVGLELHRINRDVDNDHYQYMNGFLDEDFYQTTTIDEIRHYAPLWRKLGINETREAFTAEVNRILAGAATLKSH